MSKKIEYNKENIQEAPLVLGNENYSTITEKISSIAEQKPPKGWNVAFLISLAGLGLLKISIFYLFWEGVGIWGNNVPVGWGWPIVNFVFQIFS